MKRIVRWMLFFIFVQTVQAAPFTPNTVLTAAALNAAFANASITSGTIANASITNSVIGATLPAAGTFTTLAANSLAVSGTLLASAFSGAGTYLTGTATGLAVGNALNATTATNLAGGAGGSIPYQNAAGSTSMLVNGTSGQVLTSAGGSSAPYWAGAGGYTLPIATSSVLGGVSPDGTTITNTAGAISVTYGTTAGTAAQGNDSRITGAVQTGGALGTPSSGTITNLTGTATGATVGNATSAVYAATAGTAASAAVATNVPYSGLTGSVPIWNQNTTGTAATAGAASSVSGGTVTATTGNFSGLLTAQSGVSVAGVSTYTTQGDFIVTGTDVSHMHMGTWNVTASGALYALQGFLSEYKSHNCPIDATGAFLGREDAGVCTLWLKTETGFEYIYETVSASAGVVPTWGLTKTFDINTGNLTISGVAAASSFTGAGTGLTGTAASLTSGKATNIDGGLGGYIPYQSGVGATALLANGTVGQVLTSAGTTLPPTWGSSLAGAGQAPGIPTGALNGANVTFTLPSTPLYSVTIYLNGIAQLLTTNYTISAATVTMGVAPAATDVISYGQYFH